jgi:LysM repeat protein
VAFVKDVITKSGLFPPSAIVDVDDLKRELTREESQQRVYVAVSGDSPILIAQKNKVSYAQLKALNPDIEKRLMIGQEVLIEKAVPMLEVKVMRTQIFEENIPFKIEQVQDASRYQGYVQVTRVGQYGINEKTARVTYIDGVEVLREILSTRTVKEPVNEKIVVGGLVPCSRYQEEPETPAAISFGRRRRLCNLCFWIGGILRSHRHGHRRNTAGFGHSRVCLGHRHQGCLQQLRIWVSHRNQPRWWGRNIVRAQFKNICQSRRMG